MLARPWQNRWFWAAGSGHLLLMAAGAALIQLPVLLIGVAGRGGDPVTAFAQLNRISAFGYSLTLLGFLLFAVALAATVVSRRRSPRPG